MLEVNVNCGFGYDINCEVVCEDGVVNLPCPSFPTVRCANQVSAKIMDRQASGALERIKSELLSR